MHWKVIARAIYGTFSPRLQHASAKGSYFSFDGLYEDPFWLELLQTDDVFTSSGGCFGLEPTPGDLVSPLDTIGNTPSVSCALDSLSCSIASAVSSEVSLVAGITFSSTADGDTFFPPLLATLEGDTRLTAPVRLRAVTLFGGVLSKSVFFLSTVSLPELLLLTEVELGFTTLAG
jgi:hypothetical protein